MFQYPCCHSRYSIDNFIPKRFRGFRTLQILYVSTCSGFVLVVTNALHRWNLKVTYIGYNKHAGAAAAAAKESRSDAVSEEDFAEEDDHDEEEEEEDEEDENTSFIEITDDDNGGGVGDATHINKVVGS